MSYEAITARRKNTKQENKKVQEMATQCRQVKQELTTLREGRDGRQKDCANEEYQKEHKEKSYCGCQQPQEDSRNDKRKIKWMNSFNSKKCRGERQRAGNIFIFGILKIQQQKQWNKTNVFKCNSRNFSENRETQPTLCSRKYRREQSSL